MFESVDYSDSYIFINYIQNCQHIAPSFLLLLLRFIDSYEVKCMRIGLANLSSIDRQKKRRNQTLVLFFSISVDIHSLSTKRTNDNDCQTHQPMYMCIFPQSKSNSR